jgi:hypothetical protein
MNTGDARRLQKRRATPFRAAIMGGRDKPDHDDLK